MSGIDLGKLFSGFVARRPFSSLGVILATVGWFVLAVRRWGCAPPWASECVLGFWQTVEASALLLWVRDRETLVAALLALVAASVSVVLISRQIQSNEKVEQDRIDRRYRAARATTPLILTKICDFAEQHAKCWSSLSDYLIGENWLDQVLPEAPGEPLPPGIDDLEFDEIDMGIVNGLATMVESLNAEEAAPYAALMGKLQVEIARARSMSEILLNRADHRISYVSQGYCSGQVVECGEIHARASNLFEPNRDEVAEKATEPTVTNVRSSLNLMGYRAAKYNVLRTMADQRYKKASARR